MIIQVNGIDHNTHRENPSITLSAMKFCPLCGRLLWRNGFYDRSVRALQHLYFTVIYRKHCKACAISFTLLPHFLLSRHRHVKSTIVTWLKVCVISSISCLEFLKPLTNYSSEAQDAGKGHSFSDYLSTERVYPGKSLLSHWLKTFSHRAALFIPRLLSYCIQAGRELRELERICEAWTTHRTARPFAYAFALCRLLYLSLSEDALFEQLVTFLLSI
ncbi:MAG: hypothetical protein WCJ37_14655 [Syntrophus sp. (in: bacteria)]